MRKLGIAILMVVLAACSGGRESLKNDVVEPKLISQPKLIYPITAQLENRSGSATILFEVSKEGKVVATRVHKSTGYKDLDLAAEKFCEALLFKPAMQNGEPIDVHMKWDVKFNLTDSKNEIQKKIIKVKRLYAKLEDLKGTERYEVETEILKLHDEVIAKIKDAMKLNKYIYGVVQKENKQKWENAAGAYPITFLLYHDFIERYGDYDSLKLVKDKLRMSIQKDLQYLEHNKVDGKARVNQSLLKKKIEKFIENNYPEFGMIKTLS